MPCTANDLSTFFQVLKLGTALIFQTREEMNPKNLKHGSFKSFH